ADRFESAGAVLRFCRSDVDRWYASGIAADSDARYAVDLEIDLSTVIPHVSGPNQVKTMTSLPEMEKRRVAIQKAYLLSCVNARLEDLAAAAEVVRGQRVAEGVEFYVAAASAEVQERAEELGYWQDLASAGAIALPSGCGPCIGLGRGTMRDGEVGISATNRNFKGRMGSRNAEVYLGSPAVVAASALAGYICSPRRFDDSRVRVITRRIRRDERETDEVEIIDGFPERICARSLFLRADNLNTDGIYAGKWTYKDDMKPEEMARVVFENYDEHFDEIYQDGDIVVAGRNFGTGSSREQAVTALGHRGIPCVIAASFSETYKRNAFNNGFPVVECPGLFDHFVATLDGGEATVAGPAIEIDFRRSTVVCDGGEFPFAPLGRVPQELIVAGGAENVARERL
ncbi:MAG: homoaconitase, partial [Candidatus Krumholzibacteriota bacterium]|nr:homoaconitase [Candidatus Krumholzibacteriota bacterium]